MSHRKRILAHPGVEELWSEDDGFRDDGRPAWWVGLNRGWYSPEMGCHTIHEGTLAEVWALVRNLAPCDCPECREQTCPACSTPGNYSAPNPLPHGPGCLNA